VGKVIRLLALDVDGTLTDGGLYIDSNGNESKRFDVHDGMGISRLQRSGVTVAIISGRYSEPTALRASGLGISILHNGVVNKKEVLQEIAQGLGLVEEEVAFAGDDINDIDCIAWSGNGFAVNNAIQKVKETADHVTVKDGGHGAVREICDWIIEYNRNLAESSGGLL